MEFRFVELVNTFLISTIAWYGFPIKLRTPEVSLKTTADASHIFNAPLALNVVSSAVALLSIIFIARLPLIINRYGSPAVSVNTFVFDIAVHARVVLLKVNIELAVV